MMIMSSETTKPPAARTLAYRRRILEFLISSSPAMVNSASWMSLIHVALRKADNRYEATRMTRSRPYRRAGPLSPALSLAVVASWAVCPEAPPRSVATGLGRAASLEGGAALQAGCR